MRELTMSARHLLERLVVSATNAISMPGRGDPQESDELAEQITAEYKKPAPDGRLVHEEDLLLAQVLCMHARAAWERNSDKGALLGQVIGVLIPKAREHLFAAMLVRPSTTEQVRG